MKPTQRKEFFQENREKLTAGQMASVLGVGLPTIRNYEKEFGQCLSVIAEAEPEALVKTERKARKLALSSKEDKKKLAYLEAENEKLEEALNASIGLREHESSVVINAPRKGRKTQSTMVVIASDWHVGKTVDENVVPGNTFNLAVAELRSELFFQRIVKMLEFEQSEVVVNELVLALLGDFIEGALHIDSMETAGTQPVQATIIAHDLLLAGIEYILEHTHVTITLPCLVGNHSRTTERVRNSTEVGYSYEYMMYHFLADHFKGNTRVKFIIPQSIHLYLEIYGHTLRLMHGHHGLRGGNGVGGLSIPLLRAIGKWDRTRRADITVCGHFHSVLDVNAGLVNGSLCGYDSYSMSMGFPFEKPAQIYFMMNSKYGRNGYRKIHLEE